MPGLEGTARACACGASGPACRIGAPGWKPHAWMRFVARDEEAPALALRCCWCASNTVPRVGGPSLCDRPSSRAIKWSAACARLFAPHTVRVALLDTHEPSHPVAATNCVHEVEHGRAQRDCGLGWIGLSLIHI
eukprot:4496307-Alexandrium_andersonii.AAC.1